MQIWLIEKDSTNKNKGEKGAIPLASQRGIPQNTPTNQNRRA